MKKTLTYTQHTKKCKFCKEVISVKELSHYCPVEDKHFTNDGDYVQVAPTK